MIMTAGRVFLSVVGEKLGGEPEGGSSKSIARPNNIGRLAPLSLGEG